MSKAQDALKVCLDLRAKRTRPSPRPLSRESGSMNGRNYSLIIAIVGQLWQEI